MQLSTGVLGNDRRPVYCLLEERGADLDIMGIREEPLLARRVRKLDHEDTIDVVSHLTLHGSSDSEVVPESGSGSFQQGCDLRAILSVFLLIDNQQPNRLSKDIENLS